MNKNVANIIEILGLRNVIIYISTSNKKKIKNIKFIYLLTIMLLIHLNL